MTGKFMHEKTASAKPAGNKTEDMPCLNMVDSQNSGTPKRVPQILGNYRMRCKAPESFGARASVIPISTQFAPLLFRLLLIPYHCCLYTYHYKAAAVVCLSFSEVWRAVGTDIVVPCQGVGLWATVRVLCRPEPESFKKPYLKLKCMGR